MITPRICCHRLQVALPLDQAFMLFTPDGEALWVEGWQPSYVYPADGRTEAGMVFTTGEGDEHTVWVLADFDRDMHRSRYVRCTPASRLTVVEIGCRALNRRRTEVEVRYTLTALNAVGAAQVAAFAQGFAGMIDGWAASIAVRLDTLRTATIR